jgi:midasin
VQTGLWIVFEDINLAPVEVLSVLLPLLEKRQLFIPERGELISAHPSFQLFATQRSTSRSFMHSTSNTTTTSSEDQENDTNSLSTSPSNVLSSLWTHVTVAPLSFSELSQVLKAKYPSLETLVPFILDTLRLIQNGSGADTQNQTENNKSNQENAQNPTLSQFIMHAQRPISVRDVMKWCQRSARILANVKLRKEFTSTSVKETMFQEAIDCFIGHSANHTYKKTLSSMIASAWDIPKERFKYLMESYKPSIITGEFSATSAPGGASYSASSSTTSSSASSSSRVSIGRVNLPMYNDGTLLKQATKGQPRVFAYTRHSALLMEKIGN